MADKKRPHGETKQMIIEALMLAPMGMSELAQFVGVARGVCTVHMRKLREPAWRAGKGIKRPYIVRYERTGGKLRPIYAWGDHADARKPELLDRHNQIAKAWYQKNKHIVRARRRARMGKETVATPWDQLLRRAA